MIYFLTKYNVYLLTFLVYLVVGVRVSFSNLYIGEFNGIIFLACLLQNINFK